ncbi:MAG TPA: MMPL family transporter [Candidatus Dormibacteraeota bacterium]|nr:MMPL family transporter [Candidatus Dormibacteraeota bacterium]
MFQALARFDIKFRWAILAIWIVGTVAAARALPSLATVAQSNNAQFLSSSAPSQHAATLAAPFQTTNVGATAVIIASRADVALTPSDDAAIDRVETATAGLPGVLNVYDQGRSANGQARKALVITNSAGGNTANPDLINQIRMTFAESPPPTGLSFHLTGPLAQTTDAAASASQTGTNIRVFIVLFVIVLLFVVYRALLAPLVTLLPAVLALLASGPLIAKAGQLGLPVSAATQTLLPVLLIGAGTDYGLFLVFRVREEIRRGATPSDALVTAMSRVGLSITYSGLTVIAALGCLVVASFALYRGLGPSLALGVAVILVAALTLLPALLAIFGRALFWPSHPRTGQQTTGAWGRVAARVVRRPLVVLPMGAALFTALAAGLSAFTVGGFTSSGAPAGSDSAAGNAALLAHFPAATRNPEALILRFATPIWDQPDRLAAAESRLGSAPIFQSVSGPLNPNGTNLSLDQLVSMHAQLGPAAALPPSPLAGVSLSSNAYQAYRSTAQFISDDGRTVQFYALLVAGPLGSRSAIASIPDVRRTLGNVAAVVGAQDNGVLGLDAVANDIGTYSTSDLLLIAPVVMAALALLLALLLRSLVAPIYLVLTVGLSYAAALGFASFVFIRLAGDVNINFVIPILLFIFAMALGEDYNILLMTRVREEAQRHPLGDALVRAVGHTGATITSAGLILAGTFTVLAIAGNSGQSRQLGFTIAFAILLDTFFVRTLLVPSIAMILGRWNWWPSALSRSSVSADR